MTVYPTEQAPALEVNTINGSKVNLKQMAQDYDYTIVVFFRGLFCPICKMQLQDIEEHYQKLADANMKVVAISMDDRESTHQFAQDVASMLGRTTKDELQTTIAYGMTEKQAREWGLYISKGREGTAEPSVFSEPGVFVLKKDNSVFMAMTQSAPFSRPGMDQLMFGLQYAKDNNYPARGTLTSVVTEIGQ